MSSEEKPVTRRLGSTPTFKPRLDSKGQPIQANPLKMPMRKVTRKPSKPMEEHVWESKETYTPIYDSVAADLGWDPLAGEIGPNLAAHRKALQAQADAATEAEAEKRREAKKRRQAKATTKAEKERAKEEAAVDKASKEG